MEGLESEESDAVLLLAREKLGLAREGEIVVKVPDKR